MTLTEYQDFLRQLREELAGLTDHPRDKIRIAAQHLKNLEFSFILGRMSLDPFTATQATVLKTIDDIDKMTFDDLKARPNFERHFTGGDHDEWSRYAKAARIKLLGNAYSLLYRLRSDDPEAWDEVNETNYDD